MVNYKKKYLKYKKKYINTKNIIGGADPQKDQIIEEIDEIHEKIDEIDEIKKDISKLIEFNKFKEEIMIEEIEGEIDELSELYYNNFLDNQELRQKFKEWRTGGRLDAQREILENNIPKMKKHGYDLKDVEKVHKYYKKQHKNAQNLNKRLQKIIEKKRYNRQNIAEEEEYINEVQQETKISELLQTGIALENMYSSGEYTYNIIIGKINEIKANNESSILG
tara:strand:- start:779 stop:1444 length:666 start_codon:yes stop_codon:yes gene_type:complete